MKPGEMAENALSFQGAKNCSVCSLHPCEIEFALFYPAARAYWEVIT